MTKIKLEQDNTKTRTTPVLNMAMMQAYFNSLKGKVAQYKQQRINSDIKAATDYKQQSDNTRVTYQNPVIQREQARKNLTNREKAQRDYPVSTIQDPVTQAITYATPIVGQVAAVANTAEDIKENGLNLGNALQAGVSVLPFIPVVKPLIKPTLSFIKDTEITNWRPFVPQNPNRYYRIVGKTGDPIGDAIKSGVIRGPGAVPEQREALLSQVSSDPNKITLLPKAHDYPMFAKGKPWGGSTARLDFDKPTIIRSKSDTGPIVWEESNIDFRHKGHAGIFRPTLNGDPNASPIQYFEYWEPKRFGYIRRDFPVK